MNAAIVVQFIVFFSTICLFFRNMYLSGRIESLESRVKYEETDKLFNKKLYEMYEEKYEKLRETLRNNALKKNRKRPI